MCEETVSMAKGRPREYYHSLAEMLSSEDKGLSEEGGCTVDMLPKSPDDDGCPPAACFDNMPLTACPALICTCVVDPLSCSCHEVLAACER